MSTDVLITAGSRRVALVRAFMRAVARDGGRVLVTDVDPLSPAVHVADAAFQVPLSTDPGYLDAVERLCRREGVSLVVPTIDEELPLFGGAVDRFAAFGARIAASPERIALLCNDKLALCEHLRRCGVRAAETWLPADVPPHPRFPLFIKPRRGRGSVHAYAVRNARELSFFRDYVPDAVVQEYLDGPEYTIDLLCGFDGVPRAIVGRERVVVRAGVTDRGRTVNDPSLIALAADCAAALEFAGAVNIQCRIVNGTPTVFEINPRFSGGISLTIAAGADFPQMLVDLVRGIAVAPMQTAFRAGLWMTNYEQPIFIDGGRDGGSPDEPPPFAATALD